MYIFVNCKHKSLQHFDPVTTNNLNVSHLQWEGENHILLVRLTAELSRYLLLNPAGHQLGEDWCRGTKELTRGRAPARGRIV